MDKDTLRIIIFLIGLLVVAGMIAWSFLKHQRAEREFEEYDGPLSDNDKSIGNDDFDVIPLTPKKNNHGVQDPISEDAAVSEVPALIQFSIVAPTDEGFNGEDIFHVLDDVGLEYGSLQIFERLDSNRLVDFAVASMVNPGIFPLDNLAEFNCPGLSFFMQPRKIDNRVEVFEDFIRTFNFVALKLGGEMWDHNRQPLTDEAIQEIRNKL